MDMICVKNTTPLVAQKLYVCVREAGRMQDGRIQNKNTFDANLLVEAKHMVPMLPNGNLLEQLR